MLRGVEEVPLVLDLLVGLELRAGLGVLDAHALGALEHVVHEYGVDGFVAIFRGDGDEEQVEGVVDPERLEHADPAQREQPPVGLLERVGHGRRGHAEGHQVVLGVGHEAGQLRVDEGDELLGVALDLRVVQQHRAVQVGVGLVDQHEHLLDQRLVVPAGLDLDDVQVGELHHPLGQLVQARAGMLVVGDLDQVLHPVHVLVVAQALQVVYVIGVIIIGNEHALAVEALDQHALPVQVGEAQRPVHRVAALLPGVVLHRLEQGRGHLRVVDEVHLRKPHAVGVPLFVGPVAQYRPDAAHDLPVPIGQEGLGLAVLEGRVLLRVPVVQVVRVHRRDELRHVLVQHVHVVHELPALGLGPDFPDLYHM